MVFGSDWDDPLTPEEMAGRSFTADELRAETFSNAVPAYPRLDVDELLRLSAEIERFVPCGATEESPHFVPEGVAPGEKTTCVACGKEVIPLPPREGKPQGAIEVPPAWLAWRPAAPMRLLPKPASFGVVPGEYRYSPMVHRALPAIYLGDGDGPERKGYSPMRRWLRRERARDFLQLLLEMAEADRIL